MTTNKQYKVRIIVITTIVSVLILAIGGYFVYLDMQKQPSKKSIVDTATAEKYPENVKQNVTPTKEKDDILDADKISEEDLDAQELEQILSLELLGSKELEDVQRKIFKENSKAVVVVTAYDENGNAINQGSGFIVRRDGAVVTNYHVISKARSIKVKAGDKVFDVEGLIFTDKENDLVILKAKAKNMPVVKLGGISLGNETAFVNLLIAQSYIISSYEGLENTISNCSMWLWEIMPGKKILQKFIGSSPVSISSGSPVFNINGEVTGVATVFKEAQHFEFVIPVGSIKDKIGSKKVTAIKESGLEDFKKTTGYWMALYSLGKTYDFLKKHKEAIDAYSKVIRIKPGYSLVHHHLGSNYMELDMCQEAIVSFKQAIRIDPDLAIENLGDAYMKLGMHKEAIEVYNQVIRILPEDTITHRSIGMKYAEAGMWKEAMDVFRQVIRIKPDDALAHSFLGAAYGGLGKYKEAIESYKQSMRIRIDPDYAGTHYDLATDKDIHYNLGHAYSNTGKYEEAIESYKQAIQIDPNFAEAHCLRPCLWPIRHA